MSSQLAAPADHRAELYGNEFFRGNAANTHSAERMVPFILDLVRPRSVVDVGCGAGAWLKVCVDHGCLDVLGIDADWVPAEHRLIPPDQFREFDLSKEFDVGRHFDLAFSLEVGEHIPPAGASGFVRSLTRLAPVVVFSAAIPLQKGTGHVNEQYPSYWRRLFEQHGYELCDCIRPKFWTDESIKFFYAQNMVVFADQRVEGMLENLRRNSSIGPVDLVHPRAVPILAQEWMSQFGLMNVLKRLPAMAKRALRNRLPHRE